MLNKQKHEGILNRILLDIYSDKQLSALLGFKGSTACYFFNSLPRFSTDLDFNLLNQDEAPFVLEKLGAILLRYGTIKDRHQKSNTLYY